MPRLTRPCVQVYEALRNLHDRWVPLHPRSPVRLRERPAYLRVQGAEILALLPRAFVLMWCLRQIGFVWGLIVSSAMLLTLIADPISIAFQSQVPQHRDPGLQPRLTTRANVSESSMRGVGGMLKGCHVLTASTRRQLNTEWYIVSDRVICVVYALDVVLNFLTGFESGETESLHFEMRFPKVASRYLSGWFIFDFIAALPPEAFGGVYQLSLLKDLRLIRAGIHAIKFAKVGQFLQLLHVAIDMTVQLPPMRAPTRPAWQGRDCPGRMRPPPPHVPTLI